MPADRQVDDQSIERLVGIGDKPPPHRRPFTAVAHKGAALGRVRRHMAARRCIGVFCHECAACVRSGVTCAGSRLHQL